MTQKGEAYAFFDCSASSERIETDIVQPTRNETPGLDIKVHVMSDFLPTASAGLASFIRSRPIYPTFPESCIEDRARAQPCSLESLRYCIHARDSELSNAECAYGLDDVMNKIYSKYGEGKPFLGAIVAEIEGEYMFRDAD